MDEETAGSRVELWQENCLAIDWILTTSFDWREMANELARFHARVQWPRVAAPTADHAPCVYQAAHGLTHAQPGFARQLHLRLDWMHEESIARIRSLSAVEVERLCQGCNLANAEDLGGRLWALLTDRRPEVVVASGRCFVRLHYLAMERFARARESGSRPVVHG